MLKKSIVQFKVALSAALIVGIAPDVTVELTEAQQKALVQNHALATLADPQYASAVTDLNQLIQARANRLTTAK